MELPSENVVNITDINRAIDSNKKQCKCISWEWMNERIYALQSRNTSSAKWFAKHMFSYLDFRCYFEANGPNHIYFQVIQVLKKSMAWHFLTFRSLSYKLEFVYMYPPWASDSFAFPCPCNTSCTFARPHELKMTREPWIHVRILIYRTWAIDRVRFDKYTKIKGLGARENVMNEYSRN